jgi:N-acetyl-gamma-glutamyl-phosphate reductase
MAAKAKIGVLGASGYTGAELVRLLLNHPRVEIALLTADRNAGQHMRDVFPQFSPYSDRLPKLDSIEGFDWISAGLDLVFCALPHGTTQRVVTDLFALTAIKIIDLSPDFRIANPERYKYWYGHDHRAPDLLKCAVYGLVEVYRSDIERARLVANPGCYTTCAQLPLIPLVRAGTIEFDDIVIDAKSGMTGAGRAFKESMVFSEVSEGFNAYGVGHHRHMAELEQELSKAAGEDVSVSFTPHLVPMNRGLLSTIYVRVRQGWTPDKLCQLLADTYANEWFVHVLPFGEIPHTRHVRGSNFTFIGVANDRVPDRAIIVAALDNLVKGASGLAIQNMNRMFGYPEEMGLEQVALFP